MRLIVVTKEKIRLNRFLEWLLYFIGYSLVFFLISRVFKSFYIDSTHPLLFSILASFIIYILNKTIKPILVRLTIPVTALTLGLFYPFINLFILKLTDWILGKYFNILNIWVALIISILISISNIIIEEFVIKPIIRKVRTYE